MGVYLLIVGTLDVAFRDEYNRHARQWMTSWRCTAVGLLAMMSCEVSVLILSLITIERYRLVSKRALPSKVHNKSYTLNSVRRFQLPIVPLIVTCLSYTSGS